MATHEAAAPVRGPGSRGIWLGVGAPILGLALIIIAGGLTLAWEQAQRQDRLWVKHTERLVDSALSGRARALSNTIVDYGFWTDAYKNVTLRWNASWVSDNFYSSVVDGMVIYHEDGDVRYTWFAEGKTGQYGMIAAAATRAVAPPAQLNRMGLKDAADLQAPSGFMQYNNQLLMVSAGPINLDSADARRARGAAQPVDYLAAIDVISTDELNQMGSDLGLSDLVFKASSTANADANGDDEAIVRVRLPIKDQAGRILGEVSWVDARPGSEQFFQIVWPITLVVLLAGVLAILVTRHLVRRQLTLMSRAESIEEGARLKAQFIATMSHELRTPLNAIIGYSELIQESADSPSSQDAEVRADAERIRGSANQLLRIINEILDHAKIDAGFLPIFSEHIAIDEAMAAVLNVMQPLAQSAGNSIRVTPPDESLIVMADPSRLSQCLLNLTGNAVKFTKNGEIEIAARRAYKGKKRFIVIDVKDTGIGMDRAAIERLFSPFSQHADWQTRAHGGTGLGLSITRRLARAMGGDVSVVSEPGKGSTFSLWLLAAEIPLSRAA